MMKKNNELKELRFNLTENMNNTMIELLVIDQMIEEKKYENDFELKLLLKHKKVLTEQFINDFRLNNKEQVKKYTDIMNK